MSYLAQAKSLLYDFCKSLRESRVSSRESLDFVRSIDRLVVNDRRFRILLGSFALMISTSFFGFLMQKASEGWLAPGRIRMEHIWVLAGCIFVTGLVSLGYAVYIDRRRAVYGDRLDQKLDDMEVEKMISLDVGRITDPEFIELRSLSRSRGKHAFGSLWSERYELWAEAVAIFGSIAVIALLDFWIIMIMCIPLLPGLFKSILVDKKERQLSEALVHPERVMEEYSWCLKDYQMSVQSKLFGFVQHYLGKYVRSRNDILEKRAELHRFTQKAEALVGVMQRMANVAVVVYLGASVVRGEYDLMKLFVMLGSAKTFAGGLGRMSWMTTRLAEMHRDFLYFKGFLDTRPLLDETGCEDVEYPSVPAIRLSNVHLKYPRQEAYALKGCDLAIAPGSLVMIVGKNGCGKTTLLRLVAKVYAASEGDVSIGGIDVRTIRQESLLHSIMYVTQGNRVADFPIDEAVTGCDREHIDYNRLLAAAKVVGAEEFVDKLPFGFQTQIGVEWPGGVDLSTGQMQRLKLVSAFYRLLDPGVHIGLFDEPMANCDAETRLRFYTALSSPVFKGKTIIVVAHDPLYLRYFPRVVVMDDGRIVNDIRGVSEVLAYQGKIALKLWDS